MGKKAYYKFGEGGWVGAWLDQHNDAQHEQTREECAECQRMIAKNGPMPPRQRLLRAYENRRRPEFKIPIPTTLRRAVFERDGCVCKECGATNNLAIDHIYPEVWGGKTTLDNLQVLCRSCNLRKSDRRP